MSKHVQMMSGVGTYAGEASCWYSCWLLYIPTPAQTKMNTLDFAPFARALWSLSKLCP